jgi:hypothetical protein
VLAEVMRERGSLTQETLKLMADFMSDGLRNQWIRDIAKKITLGSRTVEEESRKIWEWTRRNIKYREDPPGMEWVQSLEASLQIRAGDCDDLAVVAGTLLAALGHQVVPVAVWWDNRPRFTHAVALDKTSNLIVDPVAPAFSPWPPQGRKIHALMEG